MAAGGLKFTFFQSSQPSGKSSLSLPVFPIKVQSWVPWACLWVCAILEPILTAKGAGNAMDQLWVMWQEWKSHQQNQVDWVGKGKKLFPKGTYRSCNWKKEREGTRGSLVFNILYLLNEWVEEWSSKGIISTFHSHLIWVPFFRGTPLIQRYGSLKYSLISLHVFRIIYSLRLWTNFH